MKPYPHQKIILPSLPKQVLQSIIIKIKTILNNVEALFITFVLYQHTCKKGDMLSFKLMFGILRLPIAN